MSVASSIGSPFYPPVGVQDLNSVLIQGNDANGQDIIGIRDLPSVRDISCAFLRTDNVDCLGNVQCATINGNAYPPAGGVGTLAEVLTNGNTAGNRDILGVRTLDCNVIDCNSIICNGNVSLTTINGSPYPPAGGVGTLQEVLTAGNSAGGLNISNCGSFACDVLGCDSVNTQNLDALQIQGVAYPENSVAGAFPGLGAIKILDETTVPALVNGNIPEGVPTTLLTYTLPVGIYLIKTELDLSAGGSAYDVKISINYNSGAGAVLVGFQNTSVALNAVSTQSCIPCIALVQSNGHVNGLTITSLFLTGGLGAPGIIANDSDVDIIRLF